MLLSSRTVVLWVLLKLWLHAWASSKYRNRSSLNQDPSSWCSWLVTWASIASYEVIQHAGFLCYRQTCQLLEFQDMLQDFNFILLAIVWQVLEIGKARVSLLHDLGLSSKWEFKIKGNSTSIWEFLHNCCFSQMICEIPSGLKIFNAA